MDFLLRKNLICNLGLVSVILKDSILFLGHLVMEDIHCAIEQAFFSKLIFLVTITKSTNCNFSFHLVKFRKDSEANSLWIPPFQRHMII
jgi:hypothetical protein